MTDTDTPPHEEHQELPLLPLMNTVIFPKTRTKILVDEETGHMLMKDANSPESTLFIGATVHPDTDASEISQDTIYPVGNLLEISYIHKTGEGYMLGVSARDRIRITSVRSDDDRLYACYTPAPDLHDIDDDGVRELLHEIKQVVYDIGSAFQGSDHILGPVRQMESIDQVMGFIMPFLPVSIGRKQEILGTDSLRTRYLMFFGALAECREDISLRIEMTKKISEKSARSNRQAILREQIRVMQEELGEIDGQEQEDARYRERIMQSSMPDDVKKKALVEVKKLKSSGSQGHESPVIRNYLDLLLDLPWVTNDTKSIDIGQTRHILDQNHYGLLKVKDRIIEHLAVLKLKHEKQGSILLLAGPPGTGKTSIGKSIADALGRKYVRISLGGVKDEAEIRGHRRTYVGALPGRIIQGIRRAGTKNPVFVLDEIDKLAFSYSGDPASALLEVLDPEQNSTFSDHYLEVPYDLSDVFFIATANSLSSIPAPLLDRMELIEIPGYTKQEMFFIGKEHLIPKSLDEHGLAGQILTIDDAALRLIIDKYTHEAGVRGLKKQIDRISRYVSEKIVSETWTVPVVITSEQIPVILGKEVVRHEVAKKALAAGVATGLAWTPAGGDILFIEATFMPGTGKLTLTGQLGDVMKESANISMSLIRSRFAQSAFHVDFMASDVHIHIPSGATPKDGPSAGITLFTALVSLFTGKPVDPGLAMTGEVTLCGSVLPVGGIREKILAAHRAGITRIILPEENERDLADIPDDVRNELTFILVRTVDEALKEALGITLTKPVFQMPCDQSAAPVV